MRYPDAAWSPRVREAVLLAACLLAAGTWSAMAGTDRNWDLQNYQIYAPFAWLQGRLFDDVAPGQMQGYFNPLLHLPWYLSRLALHGQPRAFAFLWGLPAGLVAYVFLKVAYIHASLLLAERRWRLGAVAATALLGLTGAAFVPGIGLSSGDVWVAIPLLAAYGLALREAARRDEGLVMRLPRIALAGALLGAAAGLKLTAAPFAGALGLMILATLGLRAAVVAGIALLAGFLAGWLPHAVTLWQATGNPLFPLYNHLFRSPDFLASPLVDRRFLPRSAAQGVFYPFWWLRQTSGLVTELPMRDWRLAMAYAALPLAILGASPARGRRVPRPAWLLIGTCVLSYAAWALMFGIYRYLVFLELLAALLVLSGLAFALRGRGAAVVAGLSVAAVLALATTVHPNWGIGRHGATLLDVPPLPVAPGALLLTTDGEPYGYLVAGLPAGVRVLGLRNNLLNPSQEHGLNRRIRGIVAGHAGPFVVVHAPSAIAGRDAALAAYGLAPDGACTLVRTSVAPGGHSFCPARRLD